MPLQAKIIKINIVSPTDVEEEFQSIKEAISNWNANNTESTSIVLLPIRHEITSEPPSKYQTQDGKESNITDSCDIFVGIFWTRTNTHQNTHNDTLNKYIVNLVHKNIPVKLYFSSKKVDPRIINIEQFKSLRDLEAMAARFNIDEVCDGAADIKDKFTIFLCSHIDIWHKNGFRQRTITKKSTHKPALSTNYNHGNKPYIEDYEKNGEIKSFLVKGHTIDIRDQLKNLGGRWNPNLYAWTFPMYKKDTVTSMLEGLE